MTDVLPTTATGPEAVAATFDFVGFERQGPVGVSI
jgi:hypothetical protein